MSAEREAAEVLGELVANIEQALASGQAAAFPAPSAWAETATTIRAALAALAAAAGGREAGAEALYSARDALYRGEGPDQHEGSDILYGEWLGNRADALIKGGSDD